MRPENMLAPSTLLATHCRLQVCTEAEAVGSDVLQHRPALICFEFDYPDAGRLEVLKLVKYTFPTVPILLLTLQSSEALVLWAFRTGVRDYLTKPCGSAELTERVLALLELGSAPVSTKRRKLLPATPLPVHRYRNGARRYQRTQAAVNYMRANLQEKICLSTLADLCHLGVFSFARLFKREQGQNVTEMLTGLRIEVAKALLANPDLWIADVAWTAGFQDSSYFARAFRKHVGTTPRQFREALQAPALRFAEAANDGQAAFPRAAS
jgi:AraC-like DNA-binding protein/CheY-like chemotaxis protein